MNKSNRPERVGSLVKEELGVYFQRNYSISEYGVITVTDVVMSPDLRIAKVYLSIYSDKEKKLESFKKIESQTSSIRSILARTVRLRFTPEIMFFLDETLDRVMRIENILNEIHKQKPNADENNN